MLAVLVTPGCPMTHSSFIALVAKGRNRLSNCEQLICLVRLFIVRVPRKNLLVGSVLISKIKPILGSPSFRDSKMNLLCHETKTNALEIKRLFSKVLIRNQGTNIRCLLPVAAYTSTDSSQWAKTTSGACHHLPLCYQQMRGAEKEQQVTTTRPKKSVYTS